MATVTEALYKTRAMAISGRNGKVATDDNLLALNLSYPKELGGEGKATNPEQLFAAGYAACFSNAVLHVGRDSGIPVREAPVTADVALMPADNGGFSLGVALAVTLDLSQDQALHLVRKAHQVCPYSNAVQGNVDVEVLVNGERI